ncbi:MAG: DegV family protein [Pseudomonadota bacterium]
MDALALGYERIVVWADLLDRLNVFPVHDSDTGKNLKISLAPFKRIGPVNLNPADLADRLRRSATGNSGNIAAAFFSGFLSQPLPEAMGEAARKGNLLAREAVADPRAGTMLDVFEYLTLFFDQETESGSEVDVDRLTNRLRTSVEQTMPLLPALKAAGVIDSGALGMFLFLEGFFKALVGRSGDCIPVVESFRSMLRISPGYKGPDESASCVDFHLGMDQVRDKDRQALTDLGTSVVIGRTRGGIKVHLHTRDVDTVKRKIAAMGSILDWHDEPMETSSRHAQGPMNGTGVHIMTDAAGSMTADRAEALGITLLDSYVIMGDQASPETLVDPSRMYRAMAQGQRVSTSQASVFQRQEIFRRVLAQHDSILYLCVGSVYTGNCAVARQWTLDNGVPDRMTVVDTGAASGRLGLIAETMALGAGSMPDMEGLLALAHRVIDGCEEFLFLDQLKYLALGGRMSRAGSLVGDLLGIRPIISPRAEGAVKVGTVRSRDAQVRFALEALETRFGKDASPRILLEYSDNRDWVESHVQKTILDLSPRAIITAVPLSLTSGVHMGPGTWGMAFIPKNLTQGDSK